MDTLNGIETLGHKARQEHPPVFHVSGDVLSQMEYMTTETFSLLPFNCFAGISAVAASIMLFLSVKTWTYLNDPIMEFFAPLPEIGLW
jgi:hypothetical protein